MLSRLPLIWVLLLVATASPAADSQNMYKWTDDQGEVHYTQFPPPPGRPVEILHGVRPPDQAPETNGNELQQQLDTVEQQNEKQQQETKDADQRAEIQKIRKKNCEAAHQNLINLNRGGNVRYLGPKGEVMRLTEEERQKRIDEANKQIKDNCNP